MSSDPEAGEIPTAELTGGGTVYLCPDCDRPFASVYAAKSHRRPHCSGGAATDDT